MFKYNKFNESQGLQFIIFLYSKVYRYQIYCLTFNRLTININYKKSTRINESFHYNLRFRNNTFFFIIFTYGNRAKFLINVF